MTKVSLVGAYGMIGSAVRAELETCFEVSTLGREAECDVVIDLMDPDRITPDMFEGSDILVHCAGIVDEDFKESSQPGFFKGTYTPKKLTDAAYDAGIRSFVYISSAHIYGPLTGKINEDTPPNPVTDYAISHYATEQIFRRTALRDKNSRLLILRPCATYGMPVNLNAFQRWTLIPFMFPKKAVDDKKISLISGSDQVRRNFISAKGIGQHIVNFLKTSEKGVLKAVNPVGPFDASVQELAEVSATSFTEVTGTPCEVTMADGTSPFPPALYYSSKEKTQFNGIDIKDFTKAFIQQLLKQKEN